MAKIARTVSGLGLAVCLGLAFVPPACGGRQAAELSVFHGSDGPTVPAATVSKLQACADRIRDPLKEITYTFYFHVEVAEDGHVDRVKHKESIPVDPGIESCLADALEGMRVPASAVEALTQQREHAEGVSPSSRGLMGDPISAGAALLAALAGVELVPVTLAAGVVTVNVGVTIYVGEEVIEAARRQRESKRGDSPPLSSPRVMPLGPCENKCQDDYENAAAVCGKMQGQGQRRACQDGAYASYKSCRASCQHSNTCQEDCEWERSECYKDCRKIPEKQKRKREACWNDCNEGYANCIRKCKD